MNDRSETKTLDGCSGNYPAQIATALRFRPDWAVSFTIAPQGSRIRVTYSDSLRFGGSIDENMAYCERHGISRISDDRILDANDMRQEIEAATQCGTEVK